MGALAEQQPAQTPTPTPVIETAADRERAQASLDVSQANQGGGARDIAFNPANEPADQAQQGGSSGVASLPGSQDQAGGEQWESILDVARQYGYDTTGYQDDRTFLNALLQQQQRATQEDFYSQLGRQLAPQHKQIQQFIQQQKTPQSTEPKPWESPTFDQRWLGLVDYLPEAGVYIGKPGTPSHIVDGVNAYQKWHQQYGQNPMNVVKPWAEQQIPQMVQQQVQQALANYRREQSVNTIVAQNADWMYQKDQAGNMLVGPAGRYVPTPNGMRYGQYINELERAGMTDPYLADRFARMHLAQDLAAHQQQQQANQSPAAQQANALAASRQQQNVRQSQGLLNKPANEPEANLEGMSLEDRLRTNLEAAGFANDRDFKYDQM